MAAPRGSYTPRSGPLAGRTFALQPGDAPTAPYSRYQQARAQALGYRGYSAERRIVGNLTNDRVYKTFERKAQSEGKSRRWAREAYKQRSSQLQRKLNANDSKQLQLDENLADDVGDTWYH